MIWETPWGTLVVLSGDEYAVLLLGWLALVVYGGLYLLQVIEQGRSG